MSMHLGLSKKSLFWIITAAVFISFATFLNVIDSGTYKLDTKSQKLQDKVDIEKRINLDVQLKEFDPASQTLKARIWITPPEKYGLATGSNVWVLYETRINMVAAKIDYNNPEGSGSGFWAVGQDLRAIDLEFNTDRVVINNRGNDKWFPFDRYSLTLAGSIDFRIEGGDTEDFADDVYESLPVAVQNYTESLSGWSAEFKMATNENATVESLYLDGRYFYLNIILERTTLNKALLFLLGLIFLGGGFSMLILFRSILMSHRPPTLSGLIWAGSTAFTMIQTRTIIPGAPRVGVMFDLFIFYPALLTCFISGGLMFYHWITKETWSREL
jgi:hypothetical protein